MDRQEGRLIGCPPDVPRVARWDILAMLRGTPDATAIQRRQHDG